jgi:branched-chain amino acid transport system ATP-binding protein
MTTPLLAVANLKVRYGAALAVADISFDLPPGNVMTLLGVNGSGKSSLARACSGLVPCAEGTIRLADQDVTSWSADRVRRAGLVYLPEGRGIFPSLTVHENLRLAVRLAGSKSGALERAFELFPVLAQRRNQRAGSLSGGEQQMVSLARALTGEPKVVIVDEPSLGLAPKMVDLVFQSLQQAKDMGMTIMLIEQFAHRALELSDSCLILQRGRVAWGGPADQASERLSEHYLGAASGEHPGGAAVPTTT